MRLFLICILWVLFSGEVLAESDPVAIDSRIRTLVYNENEVFKVFVQHGYQTSIEFEPTEQLLTLSLGSTSAFKVTPSGNRLFVKVLQENRHTNMTVLTDKRAYHFELFSRVQSDKDVTYVMRFYYPEDNIDDVEVTEDFKAEVFDTSKIEMPSQPSVEALVEGVKMPDHTAGADFNYNYSLAGPETLSPIKVFDDGQRTYLSFPNNNIDAPQIFNVTLGGKEMPIYGVPEGEYIVLPQVFSNIALRRGSEVLCVFNESVMTPGVMR